MSKVKSVLFVCTGNSCRSIMAEALLKKYLKESGREDIEVQSAGVAAIDGLPPTKETIDVLATEGADASGAKSKRLTDEMIKNAGLVLVMAAHHMDDILTRAPEAAAKTHLLKQFGLTSDTKTCEDLDIADPIGMPLSIYGEVLEEIKREIKRIAALL